MQNIVILYCIDFSPILTILDLIIIHYVIYMSVI